MSTFRLRSAEYLEKFYEKCYLEIDGDSGSLEVSYMRGFLGKTRTSLTKMEFDATTTVLAQGTRVTLKGLVMVAESEADASEIARIFRMPAVALAAATAAKENVASDAGEAVHAFLKGREESLLILAKLAQDPRGVAVSSFAASADDASDPVDAVVVDASKRLSEPLEKMNSSLEKLEASGAKELSEKLYAVAYALGSLQDSIFSAKAVTEPELIFLADLGITLPKDQTLKLSAVPDLMPRMTAAQ